MTELDDWTRLRTRNPSFASGDRPPTNNCRPCPNCAASLLWTGGEACRKREYGLVIRSKPAAWQELTRCQVQGPPMLSPRFRPVQQSPLSRETGIGEQRPLNRGGGAGVGGQQVTVTGRETAGNQLRTHVRSPRPAQSAPKKASGHRLRPIAQETFPRCGLRPFGFWPISVINLSSVSSSQAAKARNASGR